MFLVGKRRHRAVYSCPSLANVSLSYQKRPAKGGHTIRGMAMAQTKEEKAIRDRIYRQAHREEIASYKKAYYVAHRQEIASYHHAYREAHPEKERVHHHNYRATHLEERRAYDRAYNIEHREDHIARACAWNREHPERRRAISCAWRRAHKEEQKANIRAWCAAHPEEKAEQSRRRRARMRDAIIGPIDTGAIKERDRMVCCICGKRVAEKDFSLDHTVPLSLGGPHTQENLRVAHRNCNKRRGAGRLPVQMILV